MNKHIEIIDTNEMIVTLDHNEHTVKIQLHLNRINGKSLELARQTRVWYELKGYRQV